MTTVTLLNHPLGHDRRQREEGFKGCSGFIVSGCDPAELLEPVEHPLDAVAILVCFEVAGWRVLPVRLWRNNRSDTAVQKRLTDEIAIVTLARRSFSASAGAASTICLDQCLTATLP